jgi:hypothetical protein
LEQSVVRRSQRNLEVMMEFGLGKTAEQTLRKKRGQTHVASPRKEVEKKQPPGPWFSAVPVQLG